MKRLVTVFIIGALAGTIFMHFSQGKALEKLYWEKENLKVELYETREQLKKIEEQRGTPLPLTVKEVELEITVDDNSFLEPELKRMVYGLVKDLLGQEVLSLPYPLVFKILDNRIVELGKKRFHLDVEAVILGETLVYYLHAREAKEEVP